MEINEMNLAEVEARLAEMDSELEVAESPIEGFEDEKRALLERKAELAEIEQRTTLAEALTRGETKPEKIIETTKVEERIMIDDIRSAEYRSAWLADKMGKQVTPEERTALNAADAVIPVETAQNIINVLKENALIGKLALTYSGKYFRIPVYSTNADASWTGSSGSTDSADAVTYIDLKPYPLMKTVEVPVDVDTMSIDEFEADLVKAIANKLEAALQKAAIVGAGSGSSQPTGIATTVSTDNGTFTKAGITKADLMGIMGALGSDFQAGACWIMPNAVLYEAMANADLNGFAGVAEGVGYQIGGKPVVVDDNCVINSNDTIFYGNPQHYHMNIGKNIAVTGSEHAEFRKGSVVYRGLCLADGKLDMASAFVRYSRAT